MLIEVWKLDPDGETFADEDPAAILDLDQEENLHVDSPVRYRITARWVSGELLVRGRVEADVSFACSRCADVFRATVSDPVFESVTEVPDKNTSVDLTQDIRESIILTFPSHPLCKPTCRGLCPRCGVNLNMGDCGCGVPPADDRWTALDRLGLQ
jgi:uncharacterized protein